MKTQPLFEVRNSPVHGSGVFALRRINKGTSIVEYLGDRVSHEDVDERYVDKLEDDNHTFLFTVDSRLVIDAGRNGNEARFINHACDPNCESTIRKRRVFIEAIRTIQPGEELNYDYAIGRDSDDAPNVDEIFACRCGAPGCRGSMLEPRKKPRRRRAKRAARKTSSAAAKTNAARKGAAKKVAAKKSAARKNAARKGRAQRKKASGAAKAGSARRRSGTARPARPRAGRGR